MPQNPRLIVKTTILAGFLIRNLPTLIYHLGKRAKGRGCRAWCQGSGGIRRKAFVEFPGVELLEVWWGDSGFAALGVSASGCEHLRDCRTTAKRSVLSQPAGPVLERIQPESTHP